MSQKRQENVGAYVGTCHETGKRQYLARSEARRAARSQPSRKLSAYQCKGCDMWHLGNLPPDVVRGEFTRDQWRDHRG